MKEIVPDRDIALKLFKEYNSSESLYKHALSVEAVMRYMARKNGENEEMWGIVGLIHDLDYEKYPQEHCRKTEQIMREHGWPEVYIRAVISHGYGICSDTEPVTKLRKDPFRH